MERIGKVMHKSLVEMLDGLADTSSLHDVMIDGLAEDSRTVSKGDLYLAMQGYQVHGLDFLNQAIERGARAVVYETGEKTPPKIAEIPVIPVPDLHHSAGIIADRFFNQPSASVQVVAITGTNGKSSTAYILAQALSQKYGSCGLFGTLGCGRFDHLKPSITTTPSAVSLHTGIYELQQEGIRHVVLEASSHGLEQGRLEGLRVDVAVLTMLGHDHLDYHKSLERYREAKRKLFEFPDLQWSVLNIDDDFGQTLADVCKSSNILSYSSQGDSRADLTACNIEISSQGLKFEVVCQEQTYAIHSRLLGRFNVDTLLAVFAVLLIQGLPAEEISVLLSNSHTVPGRMQQISKPGQPSVIVDYAHTPDALENVLQTCRTMSEGKLHCVFGCGGNRDKDKRSLMGNIASRLSDSVVLTDDNPRDEDPEQIIQDILSGVSPHSDVEVERERGSAIKSVIHKSQVEDYVLIAGKGNEAYQIVRGEKIPMNDQQLVYEAFEEVQGVVA